MRSCLSLIGCLTLTVAAIAAGWLMRDEIAAIWDRLDDRFGPGVEAAAPTAPELSQHVETKIVALGRGEVKEVSLTPEELNSWVRYGLQRFFPDFVSDVSASVDEYDRLVLSGRVTVSGVPGIDRIGPISSLVDTADVLLRGRLDALRPGRGVLYVDGLQIGPLLLPDRLRNELMEDAGNVRDDGLPANALTFELPEFVTDVGVHGGQIVLKRSAK